MPNFVSFRGIPVSSEYKYLGIRLDDCGTVKPALKHLNQNLRKFKSALSLIWANKLPQSTRYLAWISLIKSRFTYGLKVLLAHQKQGVRVFYEKLLYQSVKALL